jgi:hypothetical protein
VTYNGKAFDIQILRNRCLMTGILPPEPRHADLLHPCRRLWKRVLPSCAQAAIETAVLGLDRSGDVPGALAPEIWFSFLKTGDLSALTGIADHNVKDISGLARIFALLAEIAAAPPAAGEKYRCDLESLALHWRKTLRRWGPPPPGADPARAGEALLEAAAEQGGPRAAYILAGDLFRRGRFEEGRERLYKLCRIEGSRGDPVFPVLARRLLAIDAERRLGDPARALAYADAALALAAGGGIRASLVKELERRRDRLAAAGVPKGL